jgi:ClpX C4-type zinc finger
MTDSRDHGDSEFDAISADCARIGFSISELGGLALTGDDAVAAFRKLLQEIPTGVGIEGFRRRLPNGAAMWTAEEELRELTRDDPTTCSFCGRERTRERHLVSGPNHVAICSECVRLAAEMFE